MKLDNALLVQWEYASEERLAKRNAVYHRLLDGVNPENVVFDAVVESAPQRFLDAGCGMGELAERVKRDLGAEVSAIDISPRMVELTRARGLDAQVADVQALPFEDASFDCVGAGWVLYHVPELDLAVRELSRVLRPGGRLVAGTLGEENMKELWDLFGAESTSGLTFGYDNGAAALEPHFAHVERRDAIGTVVFPDRETMTEFVAANITRSHLADRVPELAGPFTTRSMHCVFVAEKA